MSRKQEPQDSNTLDRSERVGGFWEPLPAKMDWKEQIQDLKQQFEEFWEPTNIQRGAAVSKITCWDLGLTQNLMFKFNGFFDLLHFYIDMLNKSGGIYIVSFVT